jgi:hypothetical protein
MFCPFSDTIHDHPPFLDPAFPSWKQPWLSIVCRKVHILCSYTHTVTYYTIYRVIPCNTV